MRAPGRMRRAVALVCTGVVLAGFASGCSRAPEAEPVVPPAEAATAVDCPTAGDLGYGSIPTDFVPVAVYVCDPLLALGAPEEIDPPLVLASPDDIGREPEPAPSGDPAPEPQRMAGDIDALVAAFAEASDPKWLGPCTAIGVIVPDVWLVDADGAAVRPAYPVDGCGIPKGGVGEVLAEFAPIG